MVTAERRGAVVGEKVDPSVGGMRMRIRLEIEISGSRVKLQKGSAANRGVRRIEGG
jgi:hypothetical protein